MPRRREPDPLAAAIGARLRGFREARGWKLEEVAFHGGLASKGHLSDIEHGRVVPTVRTLQTLADHLGVGLVDVVSFPERGGRDALVDASRVVDDAVIARWVAEARGLAGERAAEASRARARDGSPHARIVRGKKPGQAFVPLLDLEAAGGPFGEARSVEADAWVAVDQASGVLPGAFAARVRGTSMEPRVADGSICLFRRPGPGNRAGRMFLVELREPGAPEDGGAYALKMLQPIQRRGRRLVELRSLNPSVKSVVVDPARDELRVVAEMIRVLGAP